MDRLRSGAKRRSIVLENLCKVGQIMNGYEEALCCTCIRNRYCSIHQLLSSVYSKGALCDKRQDEVKKDPDKS
jgi:hypothetical protein